MLGLQTLTIPIILDDTCPSTGTSSTARVPLTTALSPCSNSRTTRRSLLSSSGSLNSGESSLDGRRGARSLGRSNSLARRSDFGGGSSLSRVGSFDILFYRRRTKVGRPSIGLDMRRDLADLQRRNIIGDSLDERRRRATRQLARSRVDAVLEARAAKRGLACGIGVHNKSTDAGALVGHRLRHA